MNKSFIGLERYNAPIGVAFSPHKVSPSFFENFQRN